MGIGLFTKIEYFTAMICKFYIEDLRTINANEKGFFDNLVLLFKRLSRNNKYTRQGNQKQAIRNRKQSNKRYN